MRYIRRAANALLFASLLLTVAVPAAAQVSARSSEIVIRSDRGGGVVQYAKKVSFARSQRSVVRFAGRCDSACTLFLSLPRDQACISPGASFGFHRAYGASASANRWGTGYLWKKYPTWVRQWISAQGGLSSQIKRMDYAYASRYLRRC